MLDFEYDGEETKRWRNVVAVVATLIAIVAITTVVYRSTANDDSGHSIPALATSFTTAPAGGPTTSIRATSPATTSPETSPATTTPVAEVLPPVPSTTSTPTSRPGRPTSTTTPTTVGAGSNTSSSVGETATSASTNPTTTDSTSTTAATDGTQPLPTVPAGTPYPTELDGSPRPVVLIYDTDTITLTGQVPTQAAADRLVALAVANSQTPGTVVNNLVINPTVPIGVGVRVIELNSPRFPERSSTILPAHAAELDRVATVMNALPNLTVLVVGHADQRGSDVGNLAISDARAHAVVNYLIYVGISPSRLSARGVGASDLLAAGDDATSLALNRRTEFIFYGLLIV
jgi:outer membrane protein OmpA-like peptidoglycan-associated protein